jgi:hypothetical protein
MLFLQLFKLGTKMVFQRILPYLQNPPHQAYFTTQGLIRTKLPRNKFLDCSPKKTAWTLHSACVFFLSQACMLSRHFLDLGVRGTCQIQ